MRVHSQEMTKRPAGEIAVIFVSQVTGADPDGYAAAAAAMEALAATQPGYRGIDSARGGDGLGITVSYWADEAAAVAWRKNDEHAAIRERGPRPVVFVLFAPCRGGHAQLRLAKIMTPRLPPALSQRFDRDFAILFTVMLTIAAGNTALQSVLPAIGRSLHVRDNAVAAAFSVSALLWVLAAPFWANRSDKQGRRAMILLGPGRVHRVADIVRRVPARRDQRLDRRDRGVPALHPRAADLRHARRGGATGDPGDRRRADDAGGADQGADPARLGVRARHDPGAGDRAVSAARVDRRTSRSGCPAQRSCSRCSAR